MKKFPARGGPFEYRLMFSTSEIDEICIEALTQAKCLPRKPEPIRIDRFMEKHLTSDVGYEDLEDGILGYTAFRKDGSVRAVRVSTKLEDGKKSSERRLRSTWAHEGGHGLLHSVLFIDDPAQSNLGVTGAQGPSGKKLEILCREGDIAPTTAQENQKQYNGQWWEWQANRAIGGLLLPKPLLLEAVKPLLSFGSHALARSKFQEAEKLVAELFDVNPIVARIRLNEMFPDERGQQLLGI